MAKKIVIAGPPHSGKSVLREGLKQAITSIPGAPYPYIITACPDGEGSWFQETVNRDPKLAADCKASYKGKFTPEFIARIESSVKKSCVDPTLIDIGGRPSEDNVQMCSGASHIIILYGDVGKLPEWQEFAEKVGLVIIAEIYSAYNDTEDKVEGVAQDGVLRGSVHHLERGEPVKDRPMIKALARHILEV